ncbi:predicted protein [Pyrenophora tritici-repentis Pt-1C-BFP]|uniref:Uncharacterized protein n=1 Tax=Pyrenophora tritici-repentis (strain Pt-1C-BFP) TaxID=426418 RepID=B2VY14_PYRTR|nr:uncharacterized protein PTRG_03402 [Pyrenophora tritici-repentis Pt-1C-BFP]EDU45925.1 predicted protein [Pyrenophora tritici-repentis Pt-1C-BFP]
MTQLYIRQHVGQLRPEQPIIPRSAARVGPKPKYPTLSTAKDDQYASGTIDRVGIPINPISYTWTCGLISVMSR